MEVLVAELLLRIYDDLDEARRTILRRALWEEQTIPEAVRAGIRRVVGRDMAPAEVVALILADVRQRGDAAVRAWTQRADGLTIDDLEVPPAACRAALDSLDAGLRSALELATERIALFHERQPTGSWVDFGGDGALGQIVRPLARVGLYVPGGTAPLPSSLLMSAIPARVAGVPEIVVCTPPQRPDGRVSPVILAAAALVGGVRVFRIGGAQAVGALAYGTDSVPRADKVCGPGNLFVTLAKRQVYGIVGIDGLPGPTETLVVADDAAHPAWVAADLLAQAEHDVLASAILVTPSRLLAERVQVEVARQMEELGRAETIAASLAGRGGIVLTANLADAVEVANEYAPEHLCLLVREPWQWVGRVQNAGGIFVGDFSYEVLGDYVAGPSHVMPTGGTARFASPLSVADFVKRISLIALTPEEGRRLGPAAARLAEAEGLSAHAAATTRRLAE
ncbi:MAG: histidinol dehydrogenase [Anaerolineae bacterium]|nr:histidinol dehydrogenase [Anaerolineae bacterium]